MEIFVQPMIGELCSYCVNPTDTVRILKDMIDAGQDIPPKHQRLMTSGCLMEDDRTLQHYNVEKGATISVRTPLPPDLEDPTDA
jgi:hypothetical protein